MFDIDKSKAINSILFVLNELGDKKSDAHKVFKILYFADQKHLVTYGRPITSAWQKAQWHISYMAMAKAVTNDPDILNYIKVNALNEQIIL